LQKLLPQELCSWDLWNSIYYTKEYVAETYFACGTYRISSPTDVSTAGLSHAIM